MSHNIDFSLFKYLIQQFQIKQRTLHLTCEGFQYSV